MAMIQQIDIKKIKENEENPRYIREDEFNKLVQSIRDFPEMLEKRPLVVDENMVTLGGNMRLKALHHLGYKKVPVLIAEGWSEEKKREFIIKDNVGFGEWDFDILANEWDVEQLNDWGMNLPNNKIDNSKEGEEIKFDKSLQVIPQKEYIIIYADADSNEWEELKTIMQCKTVRQGGCTIGSASDKATTGLERVFNLETFKKRLNL